MLRDDEEGAWKLLSHAIENHVPYLEFLGIFTDEFDIYRFDLKKVIPDGDDQKFVYIYGQNGTFVLNELIYFNDIHCAVSSGGGGGYDDPGYNNMISCCTLSPEVEFNNSFTIEVTQDQTISGIRSTINGALYGRWMGGSAGMCTVDGRGTYLENATDIRFMTEDGQDMTNMEVTVYGLVKNGND